MKKLLERAAQRNPGPFRTGSSELSGDLRQGTCRPLPERRISLIYGRVLQTSEWILSGSLILILASLLVISRFHEHRKKQYLTSCSSVIERLVDIEIGGEVSRPGVYSALPGVRLGDLVKKSRPKRFADLRGFDLDSPVEVPLNMVIPKLTEITVRVEGAVAEEVELTIPSGSRVCDLKSKIHLDKGADPAYLKRRRLLQNGEVIVIPRQQSKKQEFLGSAVKLEKSKACLKIVA